MATVSATQLATWSAAAGIGGQDQAVSVAIALAAGGDPAAPQGAWGIGGGGDGQAQANAAADRFHVSGWSSFPTHRTGSYAFYMPVALAAIQPVPVQSAVLTSAVVAGPGGTPPGPGETELQKLARELANVLPFGNQVAGAGAAVGQAVQAPVKAVTEPFLVPIKFLEDPQTWVRVAKIITGLALIAIGGVKFGLDNVFGGPVRMMDRAGDEIANRASVVGIFGGPTGRVAAGASTVIHNHPPASAAPEKPTRAAPVPRRTAARRSATPKPDSPRVAEAKRILREAEAEKRAQRDKEAK